MIIIDRDRDMRFPRDLYLYGCVQTLEKIYNIFENKKSQYGNEKKIAAALKH